MSSWFYRETDAPPQDGNAPVVAANLPTEAVETGADAEQATPLTPLSSDTELGLAQEPNGPPSYASLHDRISKILQGALTTASVLNDTHVYSWSRWGLQVYVSLPMPDKKETKQKAATAVSTLVYTNKSTLASVIEHFAVHYDSSSLCEIIWKQWPGFGDSEDSEAKLRVAAETLASAVCEVGQMLLVEFVLERAQSDRPLQQQLRFGQADFSTWLRTSAGQEVLNTAALECPLRRGPAGWLRTLDIFEALGTVHLPGALPPAPGAPVHHDRQTFFSLDTYLAGFLAAHQHSRKNNGLATSFFEQCVYAIATSEHSAHVTSEVGTQQFLDLFHNEFDRTSKSLFAAHAEALEETPASSNPELGGGPSQEDTPATPTSGTNCTTWDIPAAQIADSAYFVSQFIVRIRSEGVVPKVELPGSSDGLFVDLRSNKTGGDDQNEAKGIARWAAILAVHCIEHLGKTKKEDIVTSNATSLAFSEIATTLFQKLERNPERRSESISEAVKRATEAARAAIISELNSELLGEPIAEEGDNDNDNDLDAINPLEHVDTMASEDAHRFAIDSNEPAHDPWKARRKENKGTEKSRSLGNSIRKMETSLAKISRSLRLRKSEVVPEETIGSMLELKSDPTGVSPAQPSATPSTLIATKTRRKPLSTFLKTIEVWPVVSKHLGILHSEVVALVRGAIDESILLNWKLLLEGVGATSLHPSSPSDNVQTKRSLCTRIIGSIPFNSSTQSPTLAVATVGKKRVVSTQLREVRKLVEHSQVLALHVDQFIVENEAWASVPTVDSRQTPPDANSSTDESLVSVSQSSTVVSSSDTATIDLPPMSETSRRHYRIFLSRMFPHLDPGMASDLCRAPSALSVIAQVRLAVVSGLLEQVSVLYNDLLDSRPRNFGSAYAGPSKNGQGRFWLGDEATELWFRSLRDRLSKLAGMFGIRVVPQMQTLVDRIKD